MYVCRCIIEGATRELWISCAIDFQPYSFPASCNSSFDCVQATQRGKKLRVVMGGKYANLFQNPEETGGGRGTDSSSLNEISSSSSGSDGIAAAAVVDGSESIEKMEKEMIESVNRMLGYRSAMRRDLDITVTQQERS